MRVSVEESVGKVKAFALEFDPGVAMMDEVRVATERDQKTSSVRERSTSFIASRNRRELRCTIRAFVTSANSQLQAICKRTVFGGDVPGVRVHTVLPPLARA